MQQFLIHQTISLLSMETSLTCKTWNFFAQKFKGKFLFQANFTLCLHTGWWFVRKTNGIFGFFSRKRTYLKPMSRPSFSVQLTTTDGQYESWLTNYCESPGQLLKSNVLPRQFYRLFWNIFPQNRLQAAPLSPRIMFSEKEHVEFSKHLSGVHIYPPLPCRHPTACTNKKSAPAPRRNLEKTGPLIV